MIAYFFFKPKFDKLSDALAGWIARHLLPLSSEIVRVSGAGVIGQD